MTERYNGPSADDDETKDHDYRIPPEEKHDILTRLDDVHHRLDNAAREVVRQCNYVLYANDPVPYDERIADSVYLDLVRKLSKACAEVLHPVSVLHKS